MKLLPQFTYQQHLASGEVEKVVDSPEKIRQFLNGMYGAKNANGGHCFDPKKGVIFDALQGTGKSKLLSDAVGVSTCRQCAGANSMVRKWITMSRSTAAMACTEL